MSKYNFLIVGAGFFGATCARLLTDAGYSCLIIEKEDHVGGLCSTTIKNNIVCHDYSSHIFHTDDKSLWDFMNKYSEMIPINYTVKVMNNNTLYSLPINMNLFYELYKEFYPKEAKKIIDNDIKYYGVEYKRNLEEELIADAGFKAYQNVFKGYYEKLYGEECKNIPNIAIRNIRKDYTYNTSYFKEKYVGVPKEGYTKLIENIIGDDIDIIFKVDFLKAKEKYMKLADIIICTCPIDRFCNYIYGPLMWKTLKFSLKTGESSNIFGIQTLRVNNTDNLTIQFDEFKWLLPNENNKEVKSYYLETFYDKWDPDKKEMFCLNSDENDKIMDKYITFINENFNNVIFGGHLGMFRNFFIDETIKLAQELSEEIIKNMKS